MRPVGGVLFGYIGDKFGRVYSMRLAMSLMALPTTAIAVLPGYATLGIFSTIMLTIIRLIQGLSVGGAFGGLMTYAMEVTPPHRVGFVSALLKVFSSAGTLVGSLVAALMHTIYTDAELLEWAWRLPFALGVGVSLVGIWMRRGLREAAQFEEAKASGQLVGDAMGLGAGLWSIAPAIIRVIVVINLNNIGFYVFFTWLPAYLSNAHYWCEMSPGCEWRADGAAMLVEFDIESATDDGDGTIALDGQGLYCVAADLEVTTAAPSVAVPKPCAWENGRPLPEAYSLNAAFMVYVLGVEVYGGMLSDRRGSPDFAMAIGAAGVLIATPLAFFCYKSATATGSTDTTLSGTWAYAAGSTVVGGFLGLYIGPMTWWMSLQLPDVATRNTAMGLTYNVAAMISGAAPAVATAIVAQGGSGSMGNENLSHDNVMWVGIITSCIAFVSVLGLCFGPTFSMRRVHHENGQYGLVDVALHHQKNISSTDASTAVIGSEQDGESARLLSSDV